MTVLEVETEMTAGEKPFVLPHGISYSYEFKFGDHILTFPNNVDFDNFWMENEFDRTLKKVSGAYKTIGGRFSRCTRKQMGELLKEKVSSELSEQYLHETELVSDGSTELFRINCEYEKTLADKQGGNERNLFTSCRQYFCIYKTYIKRNDWKERHKVKRKPEVVKRELEVDLNDIEVLYNVFLSAKKNGLKSRYYKDKFFCEAENHKRAIVAMNLARSRFAFHDEENIVPLTRIIYDACCFIAKEVKTRIQLDEAKPEDYKNHECILAASDAASKLLKRAKEIYFELTNCEYATSGKKYTFRSRIGARHQTHITKTAGDEECKIQIKVNRFGNSPEVVVILNDDTSRHTCSLVETNLGRLSTKCERKIVELLQSGLEVYQVVRKIRKEFSDPNDTNFVDYITVINVARKFNLDSSLSRTDHDDSNLLLKSKDFENICRIYKPCRPPREIPVEQDTAFLQECIGIQLAPEVIQDDKLFYILLASPSMIEKLAIYGNMLLGDSTHNVTNLDKLKLILIMVSDSSGTGRPVCWILTNREDSEIYKITFEALNKLLKERQAAFVWKPRVLMTDMATAMFNGLKDAGDDIGSDTINIWCYWHVIKAWQQQISQNWEVVNGISKDEDNYRRNTIYHFLEKAANARKEKKASIDEIVRLLEIYQQPKLLHYFKTHYFSKTEKWMMAYRYKNNIKDNAGNVLKNNMRCESWFRTLKYGYMRGIRNKKLGTLLRLLLCEIQRQDIKDKIEKVKPNRNKPHLWKYSFKDGIISYNATDTNDDLIHNEVRDIINNIIIQLESREATVVTNKMYSSSICCPSVSVSDDVEINEYYVPNQAVDETSIEKISCGLNRSEVNGIKNYLLWLKNELRSYYHEDDYKVLVKILDERTYDYLRLHESGPVSCCPPFESLPRQKILIEKQRYSSSKQRHALSHQERKTSLPPLKRKRTSAAPKTKGPTSGKIGLYQKYSEEILAKGLRDIETYCGVSVPES